MIDADITQASCSRRGERERIFYVQRKSKTNCGQEGHGDHQNIK